MVLVECRKVRNITFIQALGLRINLDVENDVGPTGPCHLELQTEHLLLEDLTFHLIFSAAGQKMALMTTATPSVLLTAPRRNKRAMAMKADTQKRVSHRPLSLSTVLVLYSF